MKTLEPHGFAIDHYFDAGRVLRPGDEYKLSFVAKDSGAYVIFCNVFCSIHVYMIGSLVVV